MRKSLFFASLFVSLISQAQNVGIGEIVPGARLDIKTASASNFPLRIRSSTNDEIFLMHPANFNYATYLGGNAPGTVGVLTITNRYFGSFASPQLRLNAYANSGGANLSQLMFSNENDNDVDYTLSTYTGTTGSHFLRLSYNSLSSANTLFQFDAATNMGIGRSPGSGKLTVGFNSGVASPTLDLQETEDDFARLSFSNQGNASYWSIAGRNSAIAANRRLNFYNSLYGDVMSLTATGNVGIGTTNPTTKLDVEGSVKMDGELTNASTGSAHLLPVAYGSISGVTGTVRTGTGNFTCTRNGAGNYTIVINGENYSPDTHIANVTLNGLGAGISDISKNIAVSANGMIVFTRNTSGVNADRDFSFIVYKP